MNSDTSKVMYSIVSVREYGGLEHTMQIFNYALSKKMEEGYVPYGPLNVEQEKRIHKNIFVQW